MGDRFSYAGVSVRAKIFFAFFAMCLFLAVYGAWSIIAISRAGEIVREAYDRPAAALIHATAAKAHFQEARLRRLGFDPEIYAGGFPAAAAAPAVEAATGELALAKERAGETSRHEIIALAEALDDWLASSPIDERRRADAIASAFDRLTATLTAETRIERRRAIDTVERSFALGAAALGACLALAILIAWTIGGQIARPLYLAAELASRLTEEAASRRSAKPAAKPSSPAPVRALQARLRKAVSGREPGA